MTNEAPPAPLPIRTYSPDLQAKVHALAERWAFDADGDASGFHLLLTPEHLELHGPEGEHGGPVFVDWVSGSSAHRRRFGGGSMAVWRVPRRHSCWGDTPA